MVEENLGGHSTAARLQYYEVYPSFGKGGMLAGWGSSADFANLVEKDRFVGRCKHRVEY